MSVAQSSPLQITPRARELGRPLATAAGSVGLLGALVSAGWLVVAAAARPSALSPVAERGHAAWLLGPLHGVLPGVSTDAHRLHTDMAIALAAMTAAWVVAWAAAPAVPLRAIVAVLAVAYGVVFLGPPQPLTDLFNYLLYGRMAAHGINPYVQLPLAARGDPAFVLSNWHHLRSPYGPLQTLLTQVMTPLGLHTSYWLWKAIVVGSAAGILAIVWWLARELGLDIKAELEKRLTAFNRIMSAHRRQAELIRHLHEELADLHAQLASKDIPPPARPSDEERCLIILASGVNLRRGASEPPVWTWNFASFEDSAVNPLVSRGYAKFRADGASGTYVTITDDGRKACKERFG